VTAPVARSGSAPAPDALRAALVAKAGKGGDPAMKAARLLENMFVRQLVKVMGQDVGKGSTLFGESVGRSIYQEMFKGAVADKIHDSGGLGLAAQLAEQLRDSKTASAALSRSLALATPSAASGAASRLAQQRGARALAAAGAASAAKGAGSGAAKSSPAQSLPAQAAKGRDLAGIRFAAPQRRGFTAPMDRDGRLHGPLGPRARVSAAGALMASVGATVKAAGSGKVLQLVDDGLLVDHGGGRQLLYRGMGKVEAQVGDLVLRGQALGAVGQGGELRIFVNQGDRWLQGSETRTLFAGVSGP
jgi:Rod binding domain-containing protein